MSRDPVGKLKSDLIWNYASLAILAASGLVLNLVVAKFYGATVLGVFNQVFAFYIVGSQFAVGGVHYSVLRSMAQMHDDVCSCREILSSGLALTFLLGLLAGLVILLFREIAGELLGNPDVTFGLRLVAPAVFLFAQNKVLLSALNGLQKMRWFAVGQSFRYLLLLFGALLAAYLKFDGRWLAGIFLLSEGILFFLLCIPLRAYISFEIRDISAVWVRRHFHFGSKGFASGVFVELNSRVDILLLGYFLSSAQVGVYSFAAIFAEGYLQVLIVIRNVINPRLARFFKTNSIHEIQRLLYKSKGLLYGAMFVFWIASCVAFKLFLTFFVDTKTYSDSFPVFLILSGGLWVVAGFIPFDGILLQAGNPGYHTFLIGLIVVSNIVMNLIFIPFGGIMGSAIATAISYFLGAVYLNYLVKKILGFNLFGQPTSRIEDALSG